MTKHRTSHARRRLPAALVAAMLAVGGCDTLLEVNDPDIITPDDLTDELGTRALRNGALSNFQRAWSGGTLFDVVVSSGLLTDEWMHASPGGNELDRRAIQTTDWVVDTVFFMVHQARADLERTAAVIALRVTDSTADERIPELLVLSGFAYIALGENFCSGVPISEFGDSLLYGEPLTTTQVLERAAARFDVALEHSAISTDVQYLARVGKARALVSLNRLAEAADAVGPVPSDWVWYNHHSAVDSRTWNGIHSANESFRRWSLADGEGGNGLPYRSSGDPRVPWTDIGVGFDGQTPLYRLDLYQARTDRFPLASGVEARLIEAEAALASSGNWLTILNDLRAGFDTLGPLLYPDHPPSGTLDPLTDPGNTAAREDLLFYERAFWLFSTGHRLGDLRRLVRQYGRSAEDVFPTGDYFRGGSYGTDVNFPVPQSEENNPNFTGCLDRNP